MDDGWLWFAGKDVYLGEKPAEKQPEKQPYSFLSLDGSVGKSADEMVLPFWDLVRYEKLEVAELPVRMRVKELPGRIRVQGRWDEEKRKMIKYLNADGKRRIITDLKFNPFKPEREILKYKKRDVYESRIIVKHEDGSVEDSTEKPAGITFWSVQAGLLYSVYVNSGLNVDDLRFALYGSTNGECLKSVGDCLEELSERELVRITRGMARVTGEGRIKLANYLNKWWGLNGAWKGVYEGKLSADLLELAKYGFRQARAAVRKSKADYPKGPERKGKQNIYTIAYKLPREISNRTEEVKAVDTEAATTKLLRKVGTASIESVKLKTEHRERGGMKRLRKRKNSVPLSAETRKFLAEINIGNLVNQMSGYSDETLCWLLEGSSSAYVNEASERILIGRYGNQYRRILNLETPKRPEGHRRKLQASNVYIPL